MRNADSDRYVELSLPAEKDMMLLVRLAASGVLARSGVTVDRLDDVKMAVEEACCCMIGQIGGTSRICLRFDLEEDRLFFTCTAADGCAAGTALNPAEREIALCILESLVDSVEADVREDGVIRSIRLCLALPR